MLMTLDPIMQPRKPRTFRMFLLGIFQGPAVGNLCNVARSDNERFALLASEFTRNDLLHKKIGNNRSRLGQIDERHC